MFENGNQYWKRRTKHGRDRVIKEPETLAKAADEYFQFCIENPIIVVDYKGKDAKRVEMQIPKVFQKNELARFCHLSEWRSINDLKSVSTDFLQVVTHIEGCIADQKFQYGIANIFNSNIVARDLGLRDKQEIDMKNPEIIVRSENVKRQIDKL